MPKSDLKALITEAENKYNAERRKPDTLHDERKLKYLKKKLQERKADLVKFQEQERLAAVRAEKALKRRAKRQRQERQKTERQAKQRAEQHARRKQKAERQAAQKAEQHAIQQIQKDLDKLLKDEKIDDLDRRADLLKEAAKKFNRPVRKLTQRPDAWTIVEEIGEDTVVAPSASPAPRPSPPRLPKRCEQYDEQEVKREAKDLAAARGLPNEGLLGKGSFGSVYLMEGPQRDLRAVKFVEAGQFDMDEAKLLSSLRHPNINVQYDFCLTSTAGIVIMELLYKELFNSRARGTPTNYWESVLHTLSPSEQIKAYKKVYKSLIDGMTYMHSQGLAHRDIKGPNIMITAPLDQNWDVKYIDYGTACRRTTNPRGWFELSATHSYNNMCRYNAGTLSFMPPEQLTAYHFKRDGDSDDKVRNMLWGRGSVRAADIAARPDPYERGITQDLWSVGATMLCLLSRSRITQGMPMGQPDNFYIMGGLTYPEWDPKANDTLKALLTRHVDGSMFLPHVKALLHPDPYERTVYRRR